jgi:diamine N-acetyltransferase
MTGDTKVSLRALSAGDRDAVLALAVAPEQAGHVAPNRASLATIDAEPTSAGRVILAGDTVVGLIVYETLDAEGRAGEVSIYRFMIDAAYQRRGIGTMALRHLLDELRLNPAGYTKAWISAVPENRIARDLYRSLGFVETGLDEDGEIRAAIVLLPEPKALS